MTIPFTRFVLPNGRREQTEIKRGPDIELKAEWLLGLGYKFEIEVLTTGHVHMDCSHPTLEVLDDPVVANEVCPNGPEVLDAVDRMVTAAHLAVHKGMKL